MKVVKKVIEIEPLARKPGKRKMKRLILVIDGPNLDQVASEIRKKDLPPQFSSPDYKPRNRINFSALDKKLRRPGERFIKKFYVTRSPENNDNAGFYRFLRKKGFQVIAPDYELKNGDQWDDAVIITRLPEWSVNAEGIIFVGGDGHFLNILKYLKKMGKEIKIVGIKESTHNKLLQEFEFIDLESIAVVGKDIPSQSKKKREYGTSKKRRLQVLRALEVIEKGILRVSEGK